MSITTTPDLNTTMSSTGEFQANPVTGLLVHLVIVLLVSGNLLIVITLALYKPWSIADLLLLSLSLADLLNAAVPLQLLNIMNNFVGPDSWTKPMCDSFVAMTYLLRMASVCTITLISADRTVMLTRPLTHHTTVTLGRAKRAVVATWLFSLLVAVLPFIGAGKSGFTAGYCFYQLLDLGQVYGYIVECIGIIQLILVLACFIALKMSSGRFIKRQHTMAAASQTGSRGKDARRQSTAGATQVKRLSTMMAVVVVLYYISWLPYLLSNLVSMVTNRASHSVALIVGMFSLVNALINPVLYGTMSQRYRAGYAFIFRKLLSLCGGHRPDAAFFDGTRRRSTQIAANSLRNFRASAKETRNIDTRQPSQVKFALGDDVGNERSTIPQETEQGNKEENGNVPAAGLTNAPETRHDDDPMALDNPNNDEANRTKSEVDEGSRPSPEGVEGKEVAVIEEDDEALLDSYL